jgi:hypothetical protein
LRVFHLTRSLSAHVPPPPALPPLLVPAPFAVGLDGDGRISYYELEALIRNMLRVPPEQLPTEQIQAVWLSADADQSGWWSSTEFGKMMRKAEDELRRRDGVGKGGTDSGSATAPLNPSSQLPRKPRKKKEELTPEMIAIKERGERPWRAHDASHVTRHALHASTRPPHASQSSMSHRPMAHMAPLPSLLICLDVRVILLHVLPPPLIRHPAEFASRAAIDEIKTASDRLEKEALRIEKQLTVRTRKLNSSVSLPALGSQQQRRGSATAGGAEVGLGGATGGTLPPLN